MTYKIVQKDGVKYSSMRDVLTLHFLPACTCPVCMRYHGPPKHSCNIKKNISFTRLPLDWTTYANINLWLIHLRKTSIYDWTTYAKVQFMTEPLTQNFNLWLNHLRKTSIYDWSTYANVNLWLIHLRKTSIYDWSTYAKLQFMTEPLTQHLNLQTHLMSKW